MLLELLQYFLKKMILQELCIVCKEYIENKIKRTLFTYKPTFTNKDVITRVTMRV